MKVYFGTSPRIKEQYPEEVTEIFEQIKKLGYIHTSDWIKKVDPKDFYSMNTGELEENNNRSIRDIKKADICVFEASMPSLSVGYLVNLSLELGKQVVVLTQNKNPSFMFGPIKSNSFNLVSYSRDTLASELERALKKAVEGSDVRFNFFVSSKILNYLDWVAKKRMEPRSVFLRNLIEKEMKKDKEFKG
ncbi:MAG: hypothetical protein WC841_04560 [Candidatus Shapirobacteria bacterium]|jgi:hypothetical protein